MNTCARSGYLVDSTSAMPADASVVQVERLPIVGCTKLVCDRCKAAVRNAPGVAFRTKEEQPGSTLAALYDTEDLASSPLLHATRPKFRLYLCRCSRWLESSEHACGEPDPDVFTDPQTAWHCAGHPPIAYPHDVDGVLLASDAELRDLGARGFDGFVPPATIEADAVRGNWLVRLRARLAPAARVVLDEAAIAALEHPDPAARGRAIRYFFITEAEAGARRAIELLAGDRTRFAVADPVTEVATDATLEQSLWRVAAPLARVDERARAALRAEGVSGRAGRSVFSALAADDTAWLETHVEDLARAAGPGHVEVLIAAFAQLPPGRPLKTLQARARTAAQGA